SCVAYSPDGKRLVSGSGEGTLKVWDADTGKDLLTLKGLTGPVLCVAYSPDGNRIVSGSQDNTLKVWDADKGLEVRTLTGHTQWVTCVAFSPDGKRIVSGSQDRTLRVWDMDTYADTGQPAWATVVLLFAACLGVGVGAIHLAVRMRRARHQTRVGRPLARGD